MGSSNSVYQLTTDEVARLQRVLNATAAGPMTPLVAPSLLSDPPPTHASPSAPAVAAAPPTIVEGIATTSEDTSSSIPGNVVDASTWKCVRVFVSSTFADMYAEREYLVKIVFPRLRAWCESRKLRLIEVDLRWGVPADSNSEIILRACLEEIDNCKQVNGQPFFVNMLGHRYGWVPSCAAGEVPETVASQYDWVDGASVTTMELLCGALRIIDNPNCLCLIRDESVLPFIPESFAADFIDKSWVSKCSMDGLKYNIRQRFHGTPQVLGYSVAVAGVTNAAGIEKLSFSHLEPFGSAVFDHLITAITRQYPGRDPSSLATAYDSPDHFTSVSFLRTELNHQHETFSKSLNELVVGRDVELGNFLAWLQDTQSPDIEESPSRFYVITGEDGIGKSAMIACSEEVARQDFVTLFHSAQSDASADLTDKLLTDSSNSLSLLIRLLLEVGNIDIQNNVLATLAETKQNVNVISDFSDILTKLYKEKKFKEGLSAAHPAIIFIDEVASLTTDFCNQDFFELFQYPWPLELRFVLGASTCNLNFASKLQKISSSNDSTMAHIHEEITLNPISKDVLSEIIGKKFAAFNKRLSNEQLMLLLQNPGCQHLGWLSMACEEIRIFGAFETLTSHISALPPTIEGLVCLQLARVANTVNLIDRGEENLKLHRRIRDTLLLILNSRGGLRETELRELLTNEHFSERRGAGADEADEGKGNEASLSINFLSYAEWSFVYFWTKSFLRITADKLGMGRTRFVPRSGVIKRVLKKYYDEEAHKLTNDPTPPESFYRRKLTNYFDHCGCKHRYREEYPFQLLELRDLDLLAIFLKQPDFG